MFECKHSTVLASKSQLASRDLTSFFVSATRSGTCLANEYDLVAHGDIKLAMSCIQFTSVSRPMGILAHMKK